MTGVWKEKTRGLLALWTVKAGLFDFLQRRVGLFSQQQVVVDRGSANRILPRIASHGSPTCCPISGAKTEMITSVESLFTGESPRSLK
jgi:hypothetical protein